MTVACACSPTTELANGVRPEWHSSSAGAYSRFEELDRRARAEPTLANLYFAVHLHGKHIIRGR